MAIITKEIAKTLLQIPQEDTSKDDLIEALIPAVESDYEKIRNKPFDTDSNGDTVYPDGAALTAALMIGYHLKTMRQSGIKQQSLGDHSVTFADPTDGYPASITGRIKRYVSFTTGYKYPYTLLT